MLQRKEASLAVDDLKSCVPESAARYHLFLFKHRHNGDYLESVGALVPHTCRHCVHRCAQHTHIACTTDMHNTSHTHAHTTHTHTHTHTLLTCTMHRIYCQPHIYTYRPTYACACSHSHSHPFSVHLLLSWLQVPCQRTHAVLQLQKPSS